MSALVGEEFGRSQFYYVHCEPIAQIAARWPTAERTRPVKDVVFTLPLTDFSTAIVAAFVDTCDNLNQTVGGRGSDDPND